MIAAVQLGKCVAGACIVDIVISKFSHGQEPSHIVLLKIDKDLKISLHSAVLPLCLIVYLRIKSDGELPFDAEKVAKR